MTMTFASVADFAERTASESIMPSIFLQILGYLLTILPGRSDPTFSFLLVASLSTAPGLQPSRNYI